MDNYHVFEFKLTTLAPVFIGSGDKYTSKQYIYENGSYYFPDFMKLYQKLSKNPRDVQAFENYLLTPKGNQRKMRLTEFLNSINFDDRDLGGYKVKATGFETDKRPDSLNDIAQFIKDPYGYPYIPGTSLKGAIKTILINTYFKGQEIPWGGTDDIFNEIRVADSAPFEKEQLVICQKWDFNLTKEPKPLPLTRECLKPHSKATIQIVTTSSRAAGLIASLRDYADDFYKQYQQRFLGQLPAEYEQDYFNHVIYLGGGTGLWTKANYSRINIEEVRRNTPLRTKMKGNGVYKLTKAKNVSFKIKRNGQIEQRQLIQNRDNLFEMGKCVFKVSEKK